MLWDYKQDIFDKADANKDGFLNSSELAEYNKQLYPNIAIRGLHQDTDAVLQSADLNKDGLVSQGELALYNSNQEYLDENTFKTKVNTDAKTNQTEWNALRTKYNIYGSKDIITKEEIMKYDTDLYIKNQNQFMSGDSATFNFADKDNSGFLDKNEMQDYIGQIRPGVYSDGQIANLFNQMDTNKDGLVSDGEIALFKLNNETNITSAKLVNAGYTQKDADALVEKYSPEGKSSFNVNDVKNTDDKTQGKTEPVDNTKDGISVGGVIAIAVCCLILVGIVAWGIYWLSKDKEKKKTITTVTETYETKEVGKSVDMDLQTVNNQKKQKGIE